MKSCWYVFWNVCLVFATFKTCSTLPESIETVYNSGPSEYRNIQAALKDLEDKLTAQFHFKVLELEEKYDKQMRKMKEAIVQHEIEIRRLKKVEELSKIEKEQAVKIQDDVEHLKLICNKWQTFFNESDFVSGQTDAEGSVFNHETPQRVRKDEQEQIYGDDRGKAKRLLLGTTAPTTESTVAFYVYLSHSETKIGPHHTLLFDYIETNVGNSYNKHTGAFIAPMRGVYLFSYTVFSERQGYGSFEIVVNSASRGSIFVENGGAQSVYTGSTGVAVLLLNQGDACTIRTHSTYASTGTIRSGKLMRTSFSGLIVGHMM
ncbi:heavy metal-binding protein HIP-like [Mytilus edulis]|uniref:heavy metal-binding protein HIP-like n=1 Tax=Mytilus edulis TaxID=6550 RepID=UPI0039EF4016